MTHLLKGDESVDTAMAKHITALKRANSLDDILAGAGEAIVLVDETGRISVASPRVEPMFGYAPQDLVGRSIEALFVAGHSELLFGRWRQLLDKPRSRDLGVGEYLIGLRKDGSEFPVEVSLNADSGGDRLAVIVEIRDVTGRKAMEARLRHVQKMEAIGNLTAGLVHDINNFLGVIITNLEFMAEMEDVHDGSGDFAQEALGAALGVADLTRRLLAFVRHQPLRQVSVAINELIIQITKFLRRVLPQNIDLALELGPDIGDVVVEPAQLEASIVNLVNNARDALPDGGTLRITTGHQEVGEEDARTFVGLAPGTYVKIGISDSGIGIPPEVLKQIFEPFFTTKKEGHGTGLGLHMVSEFARQAGGDVIVYSEPGLGTTLALLLPCLAAVEPVSANMSVNTRSSATWAPNRQSF